MILEISVGCQRCGTTLVRSGPAFVCGYECSFCEGCATVMNRVCPNCGGELVRRAGCGKEGT